MTTPKLIDESVLHTHGEPPRTRAEISCATVTTAPWGASSCRAHAPAKASTEIPTS